MSKKLKTVLDLRKSLGLNQTEFWTKIGVTQVRRISVRK